MAQAAGVRVEWLATGEGAVLVTAAAGLVVEQPRAGYAYVPLFELAAKGGASGRVVEQERIVDVLAFKEDWIRQELRVRPGDLRLIYVEGDSMEPDLRAGDIILIDHTDTSARRTTSGCPRMILRSSASSWAACVAFTGVVDGCMCSGL